MLTISEIQDHLYIMLVKRMILNILYQEDHYWGPLGIKVLFLGMMI